VGIVIEGNIIRMLCPKPRGVTLLQPGSHGNNESEKSIIPEKIKSIILIVVNKCFSIPLLIPIPNKIIYIPNKLKPNIFIITFVGASEVASSLTN
jgi:hypothetical protein